MNGHKYLDILTNESGLLNARAIAQSKQCIRLCQYVSQIGANLSANYRLTCVNEAVIAHHHEHAVVSHRAGHRFSGEDF